MNTDDEKKIKKRIDESDYPFSQRLSGFRKLACSKIKATKSVRYAGRAYDYAPEKAYLDFISLNEKTFGIHCYQKISVKVCENPVMEIHSEQIEKPKNKEDEKKVTKTEDRKIYILQIIQTYIDDIHSSDRYYSEDVVAYDKDQKKMGANTTYSKRRAWAVALRVAPEEDEDGEVVREKDGGMIDSNIPNRFES